MKKKIYKITSIKLFLIIFTLFAFCTAIYAYENNAGLEFVILPNGTAVDSRISEQVADVVIRHFQAIEDGDIRAFRDTLIGQDGADMNRHISLILDLFSNLLDIDQDILDYFSANAMFPRGARIDFNIPPKAQNKGIFVREIRMVNNLWFELAAKVSSNENEEKIYMILLMKDFDEKPFINARVEYEEYILFWLGWRSMEEWYEYWKENQP